MQRLLVIPVMLSAFVVIVGCSTDKPLVPNDDIIHGSPVISPEMVASLSETAESDRVRTALLIPVSVGTLSRAKECETEVSKDARYSGELTAEEVRGRIIFQNSAKGNHTHFEDVIVETPVVDAGQVVRFDCATDADLRAFDAGLPCEVDFVVTTGGCSSDPGPYITLDGEIRLGGSNDVVILAEGLTIRFSKQPRLGGVGGNPLISFQFLDGSGAPMSEVFVLGRCLQLGR